MSTHTRGYTLTDVTPLFLARTSRHPGRPFPACPPLARKPGLCMYMCVCAFVWGVCVWNNITAHILQKYSQEELTSFCVRWPSALRAGHLSTWSNKGAQILYNVHSLTLMLTLTPPNLFLAKYTRCKPQTNEFCYLSQSDTKLLGPSVLHLSLLCLPILLAKTCSISPLSLPALLAKLQSLVQTSGNTQTHTHKHTHTHIHSYAGCKKRAHMD